MSPFLVGTCRARCADTGKSCVLSAGHRGEHASGKHRFTKLAEPGQTHFAERARLDLAAQSNSEGEGSWAPDNAPPSTPAFASLITSRVIEQAPPPPPPARAEPFRTAFTSPPNEEAMAEEKTCTKCGKKLRSDNNRGFCSRGCLPGESAAPTDREAPDKVEAREKRTAALIEAKRRHLAEKASGGKAEETLTRFRQLAQALGFEADEVLAEYAAGWIERARTAVRPSEPSSVRAVLEQLAAPPPAIAQNAPPSSSKQEPPDDDELGAEFLRSVRPDVRITGGP